jgi:gliding motility-associated lipoprotein GldH
MDRLNQTTLNKVLKQGAFFLLLPLLALSCDPNRIYEENLAVENNTWHADDIKTFEFEMTDTLSALDLFINVRTTTDYPYSNLYLFLYSSYPDGYKDKDTLEFILAQPDGKWLGESSGTVVENQILISRGGRFRVPGKYTFKLQQAMREEELGEIIDVGFRVAYMDVK